MFPAFCTGSSLPEEGSLVQPKTIRLRLATRSGFSPLEGFMNEEDYHSVVDSNRLASGVIFGLPVVLDTEREDIAPGDRILLTYQGQVGPWRCLLGCAAAVQEEGGNIFLLAAGCGWRRRGGRSRDSCRASGPASPWPRRRRPASRSRASCHSTTPPCVLSTPAALHLLRCDDSWHAGQALAPVPPVLLPRHERAWQCSAQRANGGPCTRPHTHHLPSALPH